MPAHPFISSEASRISSPRPTAASSSLANSACIRDTILLDASFCARHLVITLPSRCSTSRLCGANATCVNDLPSLPLNSIRSNFPPLSPSTNAVTIVFD